MGESGGWPPPADAVPPGGGWAPRDAVPPGDSWGLRDAAPPAGAYPVYTPNGPVWTAQTNGFAIASLATSLLGFLCAGGIGSVVALVLGYVALSQIRRSGGTQEGTAVCR